MEDLIVDGVRVAGEIAQGLAGSGGKRRQKDTMSEAEREKRRQLELLKQSKTYSSEEWGQKQYETSTAPLESEKKRDKFKKGARKFRDKARSGGEKINAGLRKGGSKLKSAGVKAGKGTLDAISTMDKAVVNYVEKSNEKERKRQERAKERRKQKMEEDMQSEEYRQFLEYKKTVADAESEVATPRKRKSSTGKRKSKSAKNRQNTSTKSAKNRKTTSAKRTTSSRTKKGTAPKKRRSQIDIWANSDNWL